MEVSDSVIKAIKDRRDYYKRIDVHINDDDRQSDIRSKDMDFAKGVAYQEVCDLLGIE